MAASQRRKVQTREEAERLFRELKEKGGDLAPFCRARGLDGRSLNCWRVNLRRSRPGGRVAGDIGGGVVRLVEVVPAVGPSVPSAPSLARYRVVVDGMSVEVDDHFREDTLMRLLDVVRSC